MYHPLRHLSGALDLLPMQSLGASDIEGCSTEMGSEFLTLLGNVINGFINNNAGKWPICVPQRDKSGRKENWSRYMYTK